MVIFCVDTCGRRLMLPIRVLCLVIRMICINSLSRVWTISIFQLGNRINFDVNKLSVLNDSCYSVTRKKLICSQVKKAIVLYLWTLLISKTDAEGCKCSIRATLYVKLTPHSSEKHASMRFFSNYHTHTVLESSPNKWNSLKIEVLK